MKKRDYWLFPYLRRYGFDVTVDTWGGEGMRRKRDEWCTDYIRENV